jgi:hypothetical protein
MRTAGNFFQAVFQIARAVGASSLSLFHTSRALQYVKIVSLYLILQELYVYDRVYFRLQDLYVWLVYFCLFVAMKYFRLFSHPCLVQDKHTAFVVNRIFIFSLENNISLLLTMQN